MIESCTRSCPQCGAATRTTRERGDVYPCTACGAWLYLGIWDDESPERCEECGCAKSGGECLYCGKVAVQRPGLVRRLLSYLRGKRTIRLLPIDQIVSDTIEPRLGLDVQRFDALRRSIAQIGIIQPLLVRRVNEEGDYEVVSGQRRLLAARHLRWPRVPVRVLSVSDEQAHAIRIAENVHREDLSPIELAESFERYFILEGSSDREALANRLGVNVKLLDSLLKTLTKITEPQL